MNEMKKTLFAALMLLAPAGAHAETPEEYVNSYFEKYPTASCTVLGSTVDVIFSNRHSFVVGADVTMDPLGAYAQLVQRSHKTLADLKAVDHPNLNAILPQLEAEARFLTDEVYEELVRRIYEPTKADFVPTSREDPRYAAFKAKVVEECMTWDWPRVE